MQVALILLIAIVGVGLVLYLHHRITTPGKQTASLTDAQEAVQQEEEGCCGMHITCEKDSLVAGLDADIIYYDDEELDRYRGRPASEYDDREIEEFREILLTMQPDDIAGWARSLMARGIEMPSAVREELLLIVSEARRLKTITA